MYLYQQPGLGEITKSVHRRRMDPALGPAPGALAGFSEPGGPVFDVQCPDPPGCPPVVAAQCRTVVREAVIEAIRLANNAATKVEAATALKPAERDAEAKQTARLFTFFFGHDPARPVLWAGNQASGISVAARFRAVARELGGGRRVIFHCRVTRAGCGQDLTCCDPCDNGWFHPDVPNTVNLCAGFWHPRADLRGLPQLNYRAAIILHEMLHMLFQDIRDAGRGRPRAACYEAFALRVAGFGADPFDVCNCTGGPCPPPQPCPP
jgi:hypothetical protein